MNLLTLKSVSIGRVSPLVKDISCTVAAGHLVILTGANGTGKSTLLKSVAGLIPLLGGEVLIQGKSIPGTSPAELSKLMAYASTNRIAEDYITVEDMVAFGRFPYGRKHIQGQSADRHIAESMRMMRIEHLAGKYLNTISDGEWQKANVCRALAQDTPLILMDEPTAFLDYPSKLQFLEDLRQIAIQQHKVIIVSTHDVELASRFGTLFWHLENQACRISEAPFEWK